MTKGERAILALREAADAIDALPLAIRRYNVLLSSPIVTSKSLRDEADHISQRMEAWKEVNKPAEG